MERSDILKRITEICYEVFEDEKLIITDATTALDIENWDSLTHLSLINEIENAYGIKFTMGEIQSSQNIGELISVVIRHMESYAECGNKGI